MEELRNREEVSKIINQINSDKDLAQMEDLIKSNIKEFDHLDKKYRVRLLSLKEKEELHFLKMQKFGQLMKNEDILLEKDLINIYQKRGVDIDGLNDELTKLDSEILNVRKNLGKSLAQNDTESILKTYKEKIEVLEREKEIINFQKNDLLKYSLENQLLNYEAEFITYLSLETLVEEKWERLFKSHEDFINCEDNELIDKAGMLSMILQYS